MPAFTFENLSAPTNNEPAKKPADEQRSTLGQIFNRLAEARTKRAARREQLTPGDSVSAQNNAARRPRS